MIESLTHKSVNAEALFAKWRAAPWTAAKDIFDIDLAPHQQVQLKYRWKHNSHIDVCSRGTGKTFGDALFACLRATLIPGHRVGLIAPTFRQSKMIFDELRKLHERSPLFQQACEKDGPKVMPEKCWCKLKAAPGKNGSVIEALPLGTDGSKIRGARYYDVIADEAAHIDNDVLNIVVRGFLATSADPMARVRYLQEQRERVRRGEITEDQIELPTSNKLLLTSTAFYQYNHLWSRVSHIIEKVWNSKQRLQRQGKAHDHLVALGAPLNGGQIPARVLSDGSRGLTAFTCEDPPEGFMNLESIAEARQEMSEYTWLMEYFNYFPADSEGFFRRSVLDAARKHNAFGPQFKPRKGMHYCLGIDPARTSDNFTIAVLEVDPDEEKIRLVRVFAWNNKTFPYMVQQIRQIVKQWDIVKMCMDAGGGGREIRDQLAHKDYCPAGERLILEDELEEHRMLIGDPLLMKLYEGSNYQLEHDANFSLLASLEHGRLQIAAPPPVPGEQYTPAAEEADREIEQTLLEMSTIIKQPAGKREKWETPTRTMKKDRYSAVLMGHWCALHVLESLRRPQVLAMGGWY